MIPKVSCVMVTGNRPVFLRRAFDMYAKQSWPHRELVLVVNDPEAVVPEIFSNRPDIRVFRTPERLKIGKAINFGIERARGEFIQRMDDDDWYHHEFVMATMYRLMFSKDPEGDGYVDPREVLSGTWRPLVFIVGEDRLRYWPVPEGEWGKHAGAWTFGCTYAFHKRMWVRRPFREDLERGEDIAFFREHQFYYAPIERKEMFIYVRHGAANLSGIPERYYKSLCPFYYKALDEVLGPEDAAFFSSLKGRVSA
jgi:glycosyltransferase involved in cell wall biosynthesis